MMSMKWICLLISSMTSSPIAIVIVTSLNAQIAASKITFTSDPYEVKPPLTKYLHVRCGLDDLPSDNIDHTMMSSTPAGLVGRDIHSLENPNSIQDTSNENTPIQNTDPIRHIASIVITRDNLPVAAISTYTPAKVESDLDRSNIQVTGDVSHTSGELGHLDVFWTFPTHVQIGTYECTLTAIRQSGHGVTLTKQLTVSMASIDLADILGEIQDLRILGQEQNLTLTDQAWIIQQQQATISVLQNTTIQQQSKISQLESTINHQLSTISKYQTVTDTSLQSQIHSIQAEVTEAKHTETGLFFYLWK